MGSNGQHADVVIPKFTKMRVIEAVVIGFISSIVSSSIATAIALYVAVNVIQTDLTWIKDAVKEMKAENAETQRRLWEVGRDK